MTTPTAKELFLAAWQAQLSHVLPTPMYESAARTGEAQHAWQPFSVGTNTMHWRDTWRECVDVARHLEKLEAEEQ